MKKAYIFVSVLLLSLLAYLYIYTSDNTDTIKLSNVELEPINGKKSSLHLTDNNNSGQYSSQKKNLNNEKKRVAKLSDSYESKSLEYLNKILSSDNHIIKTDMISDLIESADDSLSSDEALYIVNSLIDHSEETRLFIISNISSLLSIDETASIYKQNAMILSDDEKISILSSIKVVSQLNGKAYDDEIHLEMLNYKVDEKDGSEVINLSFSIVSEAEKKEFIDFQKSRNDTSNFLGRIPIESSPENLSHWIKAKGMLEDDQEVFVQEAYNQVSLEKRVGILVYAPEITKQLDVKTIIHDLSVLFRKGISEDSLGNTKKIVGNFLEIKNSALDVDNQLLSKEIDSLIEELLRSNIYNNQSYSYAVQELMKK